MPHFFVSANDDLPIVCEECCKKISIGREYWQGALRGRFATYPLQDTLCGKATLCAPCYRRLRALLETRHRIIDVEYLCGAIDAILDPDMRHALGKEETKILMKEGPVFLISKFASCSGLQKKSPFMENIPFLGC